MTARKKKKADSRGRKLGKTYWDQALRGIQRAQKELDRAEKTVTSFLKSEGVV